MNDVVILIFQKSKVNRKPVLSRNAFLLTEWELYKYYLNKNSFFDRITKKYCEMRF